MSMKDSKYLAPFIAGTGAGLLVDVSTYPVDTVKTRLQSSQGFLASGGLSGIYRGLSAVIVGGAPSGALFFVSYEAVRCAPGVHVLPASLVDMAAACAGEVFALIARVPCEIVKQRAQTTSHSPAVLLVETARTEGIRGLYRGYFSTLGREIPFALLQFPLWEALKRVWARQEGRSRVLPWQSAVCGALSGGVAAGMTTPLDVAKTRIMLADRGSELAGGSITRAVRTVFIESGVRGLFAGVVPRVTQMSLGGLVFLGSYDKILDFVRKC